MAEKQKLAQLAARPYKDQAVWFLNAFWDQLQAKGEAEKLWSFVHKAAELDLERKADGTELDEFQAHRFLEHFKETMTVQAMRDKLRSLGAIETGVAKKVPLIHMLIFKYGVDWKELVNAPQGNKDDIEKAQKLLDEVTAAFQASEARDQEAAEAVRTATRQEADAKAAEQEAHAREEELRAAKQELDAALHELQAQEEAFNARTAELTRLSEEGSIVAKNRAKNELAQHLSSDPLPLRKAKITQEAAVKKAERAAQAAREATERASTARAAAQAARREAEEAKAAAEAALEEAKQRLAAAEAYLEEVKNTLPLGGSWWMERELHERRAYLPASKGGYNKRTV
ncbi:protein tolA, putative [Acanthamoeba castellanii str. Neff]|uniref:Protein tolA, putative n=1 Tax=Acanthamoeba castellanii (strain ATCC 30010 / Neff) TaxID=1257118 RepID=L8GWT7_ACACF|nr:protein tolA, putative [Acanthamoeba castellanii str. Neff]ELR17038.1 protein tolA, putative [Acanthamoeba castellanii str. Neff]